MAESHVRIDEGIPRGPRKARKPTRNVTAPLIAFDQGRLANLDPQAVLERYIGGETGTQIAQSLQVTRQALSCWMRVHAEDAWKDAQIVQALELKDKAQDDLANASDALALACAREQLRSAQWDLERVYHRIYGQKQEVTVKNEEHITLVLEGSVGQLIEKIAASKHTPQVIDIPSDAVQQLPKPIP